MIYFDNSSTTFPKPKTVMEAVMSAFSEYGGNPGRSANTLSQKTAQKIQEARENIAEFFGAPNPLDVIFTNNCTHATNIAIKGLLKKGDHVIISDVEHNAVLRPIHTLAQRGLITYSIAETFPDAKATVESFEKLLSPATRLIACSHASNILGAINPLKEIGAFCKEKGILFLVDAAQTAGLLNIDVSTLGIDFLCTAGHKGLYGPTGTGLLVTSKSDILDTMIEGGTGTFSEVYEQPHVMPEYLESGTPNTLGILGLNAGVWFVKKETCTRIYKHEMDIALYIFKELLKNKSIKLYEPNFSFGTHVPMVLFNIEGMKTGVVMAKLSDMGFAIRGGLHCSPLSHEKIDTIGIGANRISVGAFNTLQEAEQLCAAIKRITG
jgi:cysteine desulfurase family protein